MGVIGNSAYSLLEKISYERIGGTDEEFSALKTIKRHIKLNTNIEPKIEEFEVDDYKINNVKFVVTKPKYKEYNVTAYGMCGSVNLDAEFFYLENEKDISQLYLEGKVVLLNVRFTYDVYKSLVEKKVAAIIIPSGSIYDDIDETDLEEFKLRERHTRYGVVPCLTIRMLDLEELIKSNPKKVLIQIEQEQGTRTSRNLVVTLPGEKYPDEIITFTAHYDSVKFSSGAYDNGTGSVTIYEILKYFVKNKPDRTLKFIWCGSEEQGLLGSHAYCKLHEDELEKHIANFNVDMTGVVVGKNIVVCTAENSAKDYIDLWSKIHGYLVSVSQGVYSSDSTPFADKGIPSFSFARISPRGGAEIHSRKDLLSLIDKDYLEKMVLYMIDLLEPIINATYFPFKKVMPDEMRKELNKYLGIEDKRNV